MGFGREPFDCVCSRPTVQQRLFRILVVIPLGRDISGWISSVTDVGSPRSLATSCCRAGLGSPLAHLQFRCPPQDRKSVGWGKSVSVRVDLGGRRIMKKKTKNV